MLRTTSSTESDVAIKNRRALIAVTRSVMAVLLALALLVTSAPPSGSATGEKVCSMKCCVGKPAHRSGECGMTGGDTNGAGMSCHANSGDDDAHQVFSHEVASTEDDTSAEDDLMCGTGEAVRRHNTHVMQRKRLRESKAHLVEAWRKGLHLSPFIAAGGVPVADDSGVRRALVRPASFSSPCDPGCGAGATAVTVFGDAKQTSPRLAYRPRPPTGTACRLRSDDPSSALTIYLASASPRGPPALFS